MFLARAKWSKSILSLSMTEAVVLSQTSDSSDSGGDSSRSSTMCEMAFVWSTLKPSCKTQRTSHERRESLSHKDQDNMINTTLNVFFTGQSTRYRITTYNYTLLNSFTLDVENRMKNESYHKWLLCWFVNIGKNITLAAMIFKTITKLNLLTFCRYNNNINFET